MAFEASLKRLRAKHYRTQPPDKPSTVSDRSWTIFTACIYQKRSVREVALEARVSPSRVRQILRSIDLEWGEPAPSPVATGHIATSSPIESLQLSVRSRNALRKAGCATVQDALDLDLSGSIRRMGPATREEILTALKESGFRHPSIDLAPPEMLTVTQSLERMQARIEGALRTLAKEVGLMQERLRKKMKYLP